jgi:hypothetical protein
MVKREMVIGQLLARQNRGALSPTLQMVKRELNITYFSRIRHQSLKIADGPTLSSLD